MIAYMKRPQANAIAAFRRGNGGPYPAPMDAISMPPGQATTRPDTDILVRVRDLHLTVPSAAGAVNILQGIDLDLDAGEAVGVVGPSGSGKTSLLMVLAGLESATSGSVR